MDVFVWWHGGARALTSEDEVARFTATGGRGVVLRMDGFYGPSASTPRELLETARRYGRALFGRAGASRRRPVAARVEPAAARGGRLGAVRPRRARRSSPSRRIAVTVNCTIVQLAS